MIYCIIKGKKASVQHTHPNNQGLVTVFIYRGKGNVSPRSFSLQEYKSVEYFLKKEYSAEFLNKYQLV